MRLGSAEPESPDSVCELVTTDAKHSCGLRLISPALSQCLGDPQTLERLDFRWQTYNRLVAVVAATSLAIESVHLQR